MTPNEAISRLEKAGIDAASHEVMLLCKEILGISNSRFLLVKNDETDSEAFLSAIERRLSGEPLQYIIGKWSFMDEEYEVSPAVLVPRDDTEVLVSFGIKNIPRGGTFADLCTGSGCVAVSALAHRKDLSAAAVEKYEDALEVARRNAVNNSVSDRLNFLQGDVTEDVFENEIFDAILSNPPYVTTDEYEKLSIEVKREPKHALTDGANGLTVIEKILEIYPSHIKDEGFIALEIGYEQAEAVCKIAEGFKLETEVLKDIEGRDRVVVCKKAR